MRTSLALGRLGAINTNRSGDIFVAFSTANVEAIDENGFSGTDMYFPCSFGSSRLQVYTLIRSFQMHSRAATGSRSSSVLGRGRGFGETGSEFSRCSRIRIQGSAAVLRPRRITMIGHLALLLLMSFVCSTVSAQGSIFSDGFESGGTCTWSNTVPLIDFFQDLDEDYFGNPAVSQQDCQAPVGFVADNTDCDDSSDVTHPGAAPLDSPTLCMKDFDTDDFGDDGTGPYTPGTDCDDENSSVNPSVFDVCDDLDNNCSGTADENFLPGGTVVYDGGPYPPDAGKAKGEACGTGNCAGGTVVCGFDMLSLTCDTLVNADTEVCDGADNNCDGEIDEGLINACGGCAVLPATPGDPCGTCGEWNCLGIDDLTCTDSCVLVALGPVPSFIRAGEMSASTIPHPLQVTLAGPSIGDTFVTVTSGDPSSLGVVGGGTTVANGTNSAPVLLDALQPSAGVPLTASLAAINLQADVRVVDPSEQPQVAAITPAVVSVALNASVPLEVWLDIPAGTMGTTVALSLTPGTFGSVPASVDIPADSLSSAFIFTAGSSTGSENLTASLASSTAEATIHVVQPGNLVINEVDYDQPSTDTLEFIEIFNGSPSIINLTDISLVLVNGNDDFEYLRIPLAPASSLAAGEYLVVGSHALLATVPSSAKTIAFGAAANNVQNGAPDGIAIVDESSATLVDALSYEGEITAAHIVGLAFVSLVEGTATPAYDSGLGSMIRYPNGFDTDDAATDWVFTTTITPGTSNLP